MAGRSSPSSAEPCAIEPTRDSARSPIPPFDGWGKPPEGFPVHAAAEQAPEGLRITLRNAGKDPFLVSPLFGRYALTTVKDCCLQRGATLEGERVLFLHLGCIAPGRVIATRHEDLVRLDTGQSYGWPLAVPREHRDVERVAISIGGHADRGFRAIGGSEIPVLTRLAVTMIR